MAGRIEIYEVEGGQVLGEIDETQLKQMIDLMEEEFEGDQDYWIDEATLGMLMEGGADPDLCVRLRDALGGREGFEVAWRRV
jgi:hypothetical protein